MHVYNYGDFFCHGCSLFVCMTLCIYHADVFHIQCFLARGSIYMLFQCIQLIIAIYMHAMLSIACDEIYTLRFLINVKIFSGGYTSIAIYIGCLVLFKELMTNMLVGMCAVLLASLYILIQVAWFL